MAVTSVQGSAQIASVIMKRTRSQSLAPRARKGAVRCTAYSYMVYKTTPRRLNWHACILSGRVGKLTTNCEGLRTLRSYKQ